MNTLTPQQTVSSPAVEAYAPKPPISGLKKPTPIQSLKPNNLAESTNTTTTTNTVNKQRVSPRSFSREVVSGEVTPSRKSVEEKPKRGMSLSAGVSVNSLSSDSTGTSKSKPKKTVRYAVRHKPRESKVKIFSQKVEIRNVSSKIGSLDNYNHKPAGGDVVIETRELNWNAQSKIGSLEKAATYVPNGGNVKVSYLVLRALLRTLLKTVARLVFFWLFYINLCNLIYNRLYYIMVSYYKFI